MFLSCVLLSDNGVDYHRPMGEVSGNVATDCTAILTFPHPLDAVEAMQHWKQAGYRGKFLFIVDQQTSTEHTLALAQLAENGTLVRCDCARFDAWVAGALTASTPFLLVAWPNAIPLPRLADAFHEALAQGAGLVVSAHASAGKPNARAFLTEADLSETAAAGWVWGLKRDALSRLRMHDRELDLRSLGNVGTYALRLAATECHAVANLREVLHEYVPAKARRSTQPSIFSMEGAATNGFSYLFYEKERERRIEKVFHHALRVRGALLEHAFAGIDCPHPRGATPLVSVVMRAHNREKFIGRAIQSVLASTFRDFELLVVDNGSTDGTVECIESFVGDPRVRLLRFNKNCLASSFNFGLASARGKYVAELDSDDEYFPVTLERQVAALESNPDWAASITYYETMDAEGAVIERLGVVKHLEYSRNNLLRVGGAGAARMWHRCVLERMGGHDAEHFGRYCEDYDLHLRVCEKYLVGRVHEVLYRYRRHSDNTDAKIDFQTRYSAREMARRRALERRKALNRALLERAQVRESSPRQLDALRGGSPSDSPHELR